MLSFIGENFVSFVLTSFGFFTVVMLYVTIQDALARR